MIPVRSDEKKKIDSLAAKSGSSSSPSYLRPALVRALGRTEPIDNW